MAADISCVHAPFGCDVWTLLYLFQTGLAGLLAAVAGLLIYLAGRSQAAVASSVAADTMEHEREMRRLDHEDALSRDQGVTLQLVTELRFDAEALRFLVEVIHLQLAMFLDQLNKYIFSFGITFGPQMTRRYITSEQCVIRST